jgi:hypothetical protein
LIADRFNPTLHFRKELRNNPIPPFTALEHAGGQFRRWPRYVQGAKQIVTRKTERAILSRIL